MLILDNNKEILKEAHKFDKKYVDNQINANVKIAILGSYSIQYFAMVLRYLLNKQDIQACIYSSEYNGIAMEILDEKSGLYLFNPDIVIILPHYLDIKILPKLLTEVIAVDIEVEQQYQYYNNLWKALSKISGCHIIQSNFVVPLSDPLENLKTCYYSETSFIHLLNLRMGKQLPYNVTMIDMDAMASAVGKNQWFDEAAYCLNKSGFCLSLLPSVVNQFIPLIKAIMGKTNKCLVLDLDNTIWGGVVADVGYNGIILDPNNALGEAFLAFQKYILQLKERGVILAICSKNDIEIAKEPFEKNDNMLIKLEDISCFIANWEDKASNLLKIAQKLNIGIDSLVFFDDNPAERQIVTQFLPDVQVVDVPGDPAYYVRALNDAEAFNWLQITKEDINRSSTYNSNQKRLELSGSFINYNDYLKALEMKGKINELKNTDISRFSQLINKSNQFNLRTQRYNESQIQKMMSDPNIICLYVKLRDKFSDYGIISCIILKIQRNICFIDTWVMSCRVLKRGVEYFAFEKVQGKSRELGCECIIGEYIPTAKNNMVADFYEQLAFKKIVDKENKDKLIYRFDLNTDNSYQIKYIEDEN